MTEEDVFEVDSWIPKAAALECIDQAAELARSSGGWIDNVSDGLCVSGQRPVIIRCGGGPDARCERNMPRLVRRRECLLAGSGYQEQGSGGGEVETGNGIHG